MTQSTSSRVRYRGQTIALKTSDIRPIIEAAFPDYRGNKASVRIQESIEYTTADLTWQEGSKTEVVVLRWNGESFDALDLNRAFRSENTRITGKIPDEIILVEHAFFCGKDAGIRCIVSPSCVYLPKLKLPAVADLTRDEIVVLTAHRDLKSSYRNDAYLAAGVSAHSVAIPALVERGLLRRNALGATQITNEGKNALEALPASKSIRL